jgi:hypothetical protein
MHHENACSGVKNQIKWELWDDDETVKVYGDYARLHTRLFPYIYAAAKEAVDTGMPVIRHPVLYNPRAKEAYAVDLEYYFGPSLYVAPVVRRGMTKRSFWLPPGAWADWWTLARVDGGATVDRDAPLATLPLYQRSGSIIAMLDPTVETLASATEPSVVTMEKTKDVLDLRAVVDVQSGSARAVLVDGTVFDAKLAAGSPALPAGFTQAPDELTLASCNDCGRIDPLATGGVRVRLSTALAPKATTVAGALTLSHDGGPARRMRWDVVVLP